MRSFLGCFTNLVKGFFNWDIDEYMVLINNFFKTKHINNKRDANLFCGLYFCIDFSFTPKFILYNASENSFEIKDKQPGKEVRYLSMDPLKGSNKVDGITKTIEDAKGHFNITNSPESEIDEKEIITILKDNWKKEDSPTSTLVQQIWDYVGEEDQSQISSFYMKKLKEAFYYLMKSLLVGEYLILNDFIEQLKSCCQAVISLGDDDEIKYLKDYIPRFKALIENSYHVIKTAHSTIMGSLLEPAKVTKYTFYIGGVGDHSNYSDYNLSAEEKYQSAIEALVHVILIDHIFITTPHNIETLHWAARIIEGTPGLKSDHLIQEICNPLLDKIYMLMRLMIKDKSDAPHLQTEFHFGEESLKKAIESRCFERDEASPFAFNTDGVFRSFNNFEIDAQKVVFDKNTGYQGVNAHNQFAYDNLTLRQERHQRIRGGIKNKNKSHFRELERISENPEEHRYLTTSFLYHVICYVGKDIDINEVITVERKHKLMSFLLNRLDQLVKSYSSCGIIPNKLLLPFNACFYSVGIDDSNVADTAHVLKSFSIQKYDVFQDTFSSFKGKPVLLFLSAGLKPTNINFLSRFVEEQKKINDQEYFEDIRMQETRIIEKTEDQWNARMIEIQQDLEHQKNSNLQLVGYLGTFIAFVAAATSAFRMDNLKPNEVGKLLLIIASCILCFAVMIRLITIPSDDVIQKGRNYAIGISFAFGLVLVIAILQLLFAW